MPRPTPPAPPPPLSPAAARCLARGLQALDEYTDAPLRLRDHASGRDCEVFDLQEEFELGAPGQRFIISVLREDLAPAEAASQDHLEGAGTDPAGSLTPA